MISKEVILKRVTGGESQIDVERIKKEWHKRCVIHCHEERNDRLDLYFPSFWFIERELEGEYERNRIKVKISQADAIKLIYDLGLIPHRDPIMQRNIFYRK